MSLKVKYQPGVELDRLVAEKFFGWERIPYKDRWDRDTWYYKALEGCLQEDTQKPPRYSENLNVAFHIFEKFQYVDLRKHAYSETDWTCYLKTPTMPGASGTEATGITAAHAICLAALRSVGVIIEEEVQDGNNG